MLNCQHSIFDVRCFIRNFANDLANSSQNSSDVHGSDININAILDPSQTNTASVKFRVTLLPLLPNTEKTAAQAYAYFEKKGSQKVRNSHN